MLYKIWWMNASMLWNREAFISLSEANAFAQLLIDTKRYHHIFMSKNDMQVLSK